MGSGSGCASSETSLEDGSGPVGTSPPGDRRTIADGPRRNDPCGFGTPWLRGGTRARRDRPVPGPDAPGGVLRNRRHQTPTPLVRPRGDPGPTLHTRRRPDRPGEDGVHEFRDPLVEDCCTLPRRTSSQWGKMFTPLTPPPPLDDLRLVLPSS